MSSADPRARPRDAGPGDQPSRHARQPFFFVFKSETSFIVTSYKVLFLLNRIYSIYTARPHAMPGTCLPSCDVVLDLCGSSVTSGTSGAMPYCERAVGEFRNSQTISAWACVFVASLRVLYCRTLGGPRVLMVFCSATEARSHLQSVQSRQSITSIIISILIASASTSHPSSTGMPHDIPRYCSR